VEDLYLFKVNQTSVGIFGIGIAMPAFSALPLIDYDVK